MWISGEDQDVVIIRFGNSPFGSLLVTKLSDDNKRSPIPNTDFLLTYSDGTFVGNDNGIYTTNAAGEILVDGLEPGCDDHRARGQGRGWVLAGRVAAAHPDQKRRDSASAVSQQTVRQPDHQEKQQRPDARGRAGGGV